jgi:hypothetical protein
VLNGRVAVLKAGVARETENATRRPVIKDELQQSAMVRPRLTASAPARMTP